MNRETALGVAVAVVVVGSLVATAAVPGVFAQRERPEPPGRLDIAEVTIAPGAVSGGSATLSVTTVLQHFGGRSENVTVRARAIDAESGLVETEEERAVDPIEGDREERVTINLSVAREGGYRIEALVYRDERRVETAAKEVRGVGTLKPAYARTPVEFHRFDGGDGLPPIQYSVASAAGNRTTLDLSAYLTNQGDRPSEGLRLEFVVRQADSNIVAARTTVDVGTIQPGRTATPGASVTVPANYNYFLNAILWKDGVIVASARSVANLAPEERISANTTVRKVGIEVGDFARDEDGRRERAAERTPAPERTAVAGGQPGFGVVVALAAFVLAVIAWRTRS